MQVSLYKLISLSQYCMLPWVFSTVVVAVPGRDKRQNSIFGNCAPSCGNQIRLSDGCLGTLEVLSRGGLYGTATDRNFGVNEATVVCRQLGCLRNDIQPVRVNTREWVTSLYREKKKTYRDHTPTSMLVMSKKSEGKFTESYIALYCSGGETEIQLGGGGCDGQIYCPPLPRSTAFATLFYTTVEASMKLKVQGWGFENSASLLCYILSCLHTFWHAIPTSIYIFFCLVCEYTT